MRRIRMITLLALLGTITVSGCAAPALQRQVISNDAEATKRSDLERELSMYSD